MSIKHSLRQLQCFVAAGQTCNVTKAAEILNVSQPFISATIVHLEKVFGIQLFIRHHAKDIFLTRIEKNIFTQSKLLLKQAEELQNTAQEFGNSIDGILSIGCYVMLTPITIPSLIKEFNCIYIGMCISIVTKRIWMSYI